MTNLHSANITINTVEINARMKSQTEFAFGGYGKTYVINSANEALGFLNALAHVMDGKYPICVPGFHAKFDWDMLALETDGENRAYVNFDILRDQEIIAKLAHFGIKQIEGRVGWLVLNTSWGRIVPDHYAAPVKEIALLLPFLPEDFTKLDEAAQKDAKREARKLLSPDVKAANETAWGIVHKQKGIELVMHLIDQKFRVVLDIKTYLGEWQLGVILTKFTKLFATTEVRDDAYNATVAKRKNQAFSDKGAYLVSKVDSFAFEADLVTSNGVAVMTESGEVVNFAATDLMGKRITYVIGGQLRSGFEYMRTLENVKAAALRASRSGWVIAVVGASAG